MNITFPYASKKLAPEFYCSGGTRETLNLCQTNITFEGSVEVRDTVTVATDSKFGTALHQALDLVKLVDVEEESTQIVAHVSNGTNPYYTVSIDVRMPSIYAQEVCVDVAVCDIRPTTEKKGYTHRRSFTGPHKAVIGAAHKHFCRMLGKTLFKAHTEYFTHLH